MDVERCREFVVLAQTRNFLEASEQLFISQSSLSKHVKSLENELGVTLLNRSTRRVELSPEGRVFLPYAKRIACDGHELEVALHDFTENERSVLDIGSIPIMVPYGITEILSVFEQNNVSTRLQLVEGDADELRDMLRKGKLELAFIREWDGDAAKDTGDEEFSAVPYTDDHLVAVLPQDHPLALKDHIGLSDLTNEEFLLLPKGSVMHALIMDACAVEGFVPAIRYQGKRAENIIDLVGRHMGVSLLMKKPASYLATREVAFVEVEPTISTQIMVYSRRSEELSQPAKLFLEYVERFGHRA